MKKFLSFMLCILMIFSGTVVLSTAAENDLVITVATDLHLDLAASTAEKVAKKNSVSEVYAHASSGGQLHYESLAIIKAFLEDAGKNDSSFVLLPGDLSNKGLAEEHIALAALLKEFEETYKKEVFVVPGNHDLYKVSLDEFKEYYAEFGYSQALNQDPDSASYTADLAEGYMLLAIDSCNPTYSPHGITDKRIDWIEQQCKEAKAQGKKVIAMLHHNVLEHYILAAKIHTGAVVTKDSMRLADVLANNSVKVVFTGHTHNHDITSYTSEAGNILYDVVTKSLNEYPCAYRVVTFGENITIRTDYVRSIDTSLLPSGIHEEALSLAETNFLKYAKEVNYLGVDMIVRSYAKASQLKKILNTDDEVINGVIDKAADKLEEVARMPIYAKDETVEGKSIEAMAKELGITLPETKFYDLLDIAVTIYIANSVGDENYAAHSDEMILFSRVLAVAINYAFSDVTPEEFTAVLTYVASLLGADISQDIINAIGGSIDKFRGCEIFVTSAVLPLVAKFSDDEAPADSNVTLPGYSAQAKAEESFLDKIKAFFEKIFNFFHMIFAMMS